MRVGSSPLPPQNNVDGPAQDANDPKSGQAPGQFDRLDPAPLNGATITWDGKHNTPVITLPPVDPDMVAEPNVVPIPPFHGADSVDPPVATAVPLTPEEFKDEVDALDSVDVNGDGVISAAEQSFADPYNDGFEIPDTSAPPE